MKKILFSAFFIASLTFGLTFSANAELVVKTKKMGENRVEEQQNEPSVYVPRPSAAPDAQAAPETTPKTASNEQHPAQSDVPKIIAVHVKDMGAKCPSAWQSKGCIVAMANSNLTLASVYAELLQNGGQSDSTNALKEHCAASTAAIQVEVPAYAMKSAMTECANTITDISEATGITPDPTHYQLLIGGIFCLEDGNANCPAVEEGLKRLSQAQ